VACGIIADMVRLAIGLTAWLAGTAIAVSVAWLGANVVVRNAGAGPGMPVISASVLPSASATPAAPTPTAPTPAAPTPTGAVRPAPSAARRTPAQAAPSRSVRSTGAAPSASASVAPPAGDIHAYTLAGGIVSLDLAGGSAQLVTAVPDAGYSVQTWSGTGWLRVDFSSGAQVSSLIASWYQHAPTVTVEN
jgi:hypothetical protein